MDARSFLCRDDAERRRMRDVGASLRPGLPFVLGFLMLAGLSGVGTYGLLPLLPPTVALFTYLALWKLNISNQRRPEYLWVSVFVLGEVAVTVGELLGHGPRAFSFVLIQAPVLLVSFIFPRRVVVAAMLFGIAMLGVVILAVDMPEIRQVPLAALGGTFILISLPVIALVVRDLDETYRRSAVIDELTGALNRHALTPRLSEVTYRSRMTGEPVSVVIGDIDHFKQVNDQHGHATGDLVLREIAKRLGDCLSTFEPVYRLGGEEFLILLPGLAATAAYELAEKIWRAVREQPIQKLPVTMSFGVASSEAGEPFDFDTVFARADRALYTAKQTGRDQVIPILEGAKPNAPHDAKLEEAHPTERRALADRRYFRSLGRRTAHLTLVGQEAEPAAPSDAAAARSPAGAGHGVTEELEREYAIDLNLRLAPLFWAIAVGALLVVASGIPNYGWHMLIPPIIAAIPYYVLTRQCHRFRHPSRVLGASWVLLQTSIALGFMQATGAPLFALPLLILLVPARCAEIRRRGAAATTLYTAALMTFVAFYLNAHSVIHNPAQLLFPLALVFLAGYAGTVVGGTAVGFHAAGTIDGLTGLMNRSALNARLRDLETTTATTPRPVAILMGDLDHFKQINDAAGHAAGDAVLRAVAKRISTSLRAFEQVYRVGGEEFQILLSGTEGDHAREIAERLREAIASEQCAGWSVTMSFGVAASEPGRPFLFSEVIERADAALYQAKHTGRNRVCVDPATSGHQSWRLDEGLSWGRASAPTMSLS